MVQMRRIRYPKCTAFESFIKLSLQENKTMRCKNMQELKPIKEGKVREIIQCDSDHGATDRIAL